MSLPSLQLPSLRSLELPTLRSLDLLPSIRTIQQDYSIGNEEEDEEEDEDEGYDFSECKSSWFSESSERGRWLISPVKRRRTQEDVLPLSSPLMSLVSPMMSSSPLLPSSSPLMPSSPLLPSSPMMSSSPELSSSPMPPSSDDDLVPPSLCYSTSPPSSPYAEIDELDKDDEPISSQCHEATKTGPSVVVFEEPVCRPSTSEIPSVISDVSIDVTTTSPVEELEELEPDQACDPCPLPSTSRLSTPIENTITNPALTKSRKRRSRTKEVNTTKAKRRRTSSPSPPLPSTLDVQCTSHEELTGMLMECMATSRASSLEVSKLYTALVQTRPSLKSEKSHDDWISTLSEVLVQGQQDFGCFNMVESSGRDEQENKSWTEPKWYYVPEQDPDQERAGLLKMIMPRAPKRRTTMKYKQYYWKPLDKISKWDDEDAL